MLPGASKIIPTLIGVGFCLGTVSAHAAVISVLEEDLQDVTGITRASTVHTVQNIVNFFGATPNQFLVIGDDNASIGGESSGQPG